MLEQVLPLSKDLGLKIDHSCDRDDTDCATSSIKKFANGSGKDVLLCWEHDVSRDGATEQWAVV